MREFKRTVRAVAFAHLGKKTQRTDAFRVAQLQLARFVARFRYIDRTVADSADSNSAARVLAKIVHESSVTKPRSSPQEASRRGLFKPVLE